MFSCFLFKIKAKEILRTLVLESAWFQLLKL